MPESEDNEIINSFILESTEILDSTEASFNQILKALDADKISEIDNELFHQLFRVFHTIKGVSSFLNFNVILNVAHKAEYLLDIYRNNSGQFTKDAFHLLGKTVDFLRVLLEKIQEDFTDISLQKPSEDIIKELDHLLDVLKVESTVTQPKKISESAIANPLPKIDLKSEVLEKFCKECLDLIEQAEYSLLLYDRNPENLVLIEDIFRSLHSFKGNCGFIGLEKFEAFSHKFESTIEHHQLEKKAFASDLIKLMMECLDLMREGIKYLFANQMEIDICNSPLYHRLVSYQIGNNQPNTTEEVKMAQAGKTGKEEIDEKFEAPVLDTQLELASNGLEGNSENSGKKNLENIRKDIRVDMLKLDYLQNLVGELLITKEMIVHGPELQNLKLPNLMSSLDRLTRIANNLQDVSISVRMVPASSVFSKMNRIVRDVSRKTGKEIRLEIKGENTEIDKIVLDLVADPLVHIIRNACDHGIESMEDRVKRGKDKTGLVELSAEQKNDKIVITVQDDGKGLDKDFIFKKAVEKGLTTSEAILTENEIYQFLFMPGFSTAEKITDISGRGVGLDVVLNNIKQAKGRVKIETVLGQGTSFEISIPLTLATVDVMLVKVGKSTFSIPISIINEAIKCKDETIIKRPDGLDFIKIRNEMYEIIPLYKVFSIDTECSDASKGILILIHVNGGYYALLVDQILYQTSTVIKGLSSYLKQVKSISGFNILGNGEVSLIINFEELLQASRG